MWLQNFNFFSKHNHSTTPTSETIFKRQSWKLITTHNNDSSICGILKQMEFHYGKFLQIYRIVKELTKVHFYMNVYYNVLNVFLSRLSHANKTTMDCIQFLNNRCYFTSISFIIVFVRVRVMVFNVIFNKISVISWRSF